MSILFRDQPRPISRATPSPRSMHESMLTSMRGSSGVYVDADSAMRHDAWWSCVTQISQDVAMMPVDVGRDRNGEREEVPAPQIITAPSVFVTDPMDWRYQIVQSWLSAGNAWGIVTDTTPNHLYPTRIELQNDAVVQRWMNGKHMCFSINAEPHDLWPVGDLWHSPAYTVAGYFLGLSPVQYHAWTIGKGLAAAKHGLQYFTDGALPVGVWQLSGDPNDTKIKKFKDRVTALAHGSREPLFIGKETAEYKQLQSNPIDSQFLDTEKYSVEQICRIFGEDPADHGSAGSGGSITYANRSDADLAKFKRRQFWVTKLQNTMSALIVAGQTVKLNTASTLMMTEMEKHELFQLRLVSKTITVNEVRTKIDEPKFTDPIYDKPGVPGGIATPIQPKPAATPPAPAKAAK